MLSFDQSEAPIHELIQKVQPPRTEPVSWRDDAQTVFEYDSRGNLISSSKQETDTDGRWYNVSRVLYEYDAESHVIERRTQTGNIGTTEWFDRRLCSFVYDRLGNLVEESTLQYNQNNWYYQDRSVNGFDDSGRMIEKIIFKGHDKEWFRDARQLNDYDEADRCIALWVQNWVESDSGWIPHRVDHFEYSSEILTHVPEPDKNPDSFSILSNYPNPFNSQTTIAIQLPTTQRITLQIFDISGRLVKNLIQDCVLNSGIHQVQWRGMNDFGDKVASGIYFYRLTYLDNIKVGKCLMIK